MESPTSVIAVQARTCFLRLIALIAATIVVTASPPTRAADPSSRQVTIDIPAESLSAALLQFGQQAKVQILFAPSITDGKRAKALHGTFALDTALDLLFQGTGLSFRVSGETVTVTPGAAPAGTTNEKVSASADLEEVTVTGTYIRGTPPIGSPLKVYTRDDIDQSGATTIEEFARQLPENFSGADILTSGIGGATQEPVYDQAAANTFGGAAFNLNGLGPGATLTLLNGHRLAPAGSDGSFVDVSLIPLSAVERIEILPDGASAIYGTDAVAGVVNIITRRNFQGAESDVSYGQATAGGAGEFTGSQLLGKSWSSGNAMLTYDYDRQGGLDASQRDFIPDQGGPYSIVPSNSRNSVLISGNQDIGQSTSISGDAMWSQKDYHSEFTILPTGESDLYDNQAQTTQSAVSLTLRRALARDWSLALTGTYSSDQQNLVGLANFDFGGGFVVNDTSQLKANTSLSEIDALADGSMFDLPGGKVKGAIGSSFQRQTYLNETETFGTDNVIEPEESYGRNEGSAYGEIDIPLIGAANALPLAREVELSAAVRFDHYSDFGSAVNPKVGMVWSPVGGLNIRGTYGQSYRAPLLSQIASPVLSTAEPFPDPDSSSGLTDTLYITGGNPNLGPEKSRSFSTGMDFNTHDLSLSATYFHTSYTDRIGTPPIANLLTVLADPADAPFVTRNPPSALVDELFNSPGFQGDYVGLGPSGVQAIFDSQFTNLATTTQSNVDLTVSYKETTEFGVFSPSLSIVRQIEDELRATSTSSLLSLLDLYGEPVRWRARGGVAWKKSAFGASVNLNYVGGYRDDFTASPSSISSWTTADLQLSYRVPDTVGSTILRGSSVALTIENITNANPPYVAIPSTVTGGAAPLPYDPSNASPVGRFVSLQLRKAWK